MCHWPSDHLSHSNRWDRSYINKWLPKKVSAGIFPEEILVKHSWSVTHKAPFQTGRYLRNQPHIRSSKEALGFIFRVWIHSFIDELINLPSEWVVTDVLQQGRGAQRIELEEQKCVAGGPRPPALWGTILHFHSSGKNTISSLNQRTNYGQNGLQCHRA